MIIVMFLLLSVSQISAETTESIGTFPVNSNIQLYQTCNNCTYVNFTKIAYPNGTVIESNVETTSDGTYYYYDLAAGNVSALGIYTYCYDAGNTVTKETGCLEFEITPSGFTQTLGFYIMIFAVSFIVIFFGFYMSDAVITMLGSFGLYFLGLWILFYGIDILRDKIYTLSIGIIILGLAFYISVRSGYELFS